MSGGFTRKVSLVALCGLAAALGALGNASASRAQTPPSLLSDQQVSELQALSYRYPAQLAGVAGNASTHVATLYVTAGHTAGTKVLAAIQRIGTKLDPLNSTGPKRWRLRIATAARSLQKLQRIRAEITSLRPWANEVKPYLVAWGPDIRANSVDVGVTHVTPTLRAGARRAFGDAVHLYKMAPVQSLVRFTPGRPRLKRVATATASASPRLLDGQPYSGGDRLVFQVGNGVIQCTSGFAAVAAGGDHGMLTAGHCFDAPADVLQGYFDPGSNTIFYTGTMGAVEQHSPFGATDSEFLDSTVVGSNTGGFVYVGDNSAQSVSGAAAAFQDEGTCASGSFTGLNCNGVVTLTGQCIQVNDNGVTKTTCNQFQVNSENNSQLATHGDSGGPVFGLDSNDDIVATGTITAGNSNGTTIFASDITTIESKFLVTVRTFP